VPIEPQPGEVWYADLGLAEKSRPVLILACPRSDDARSLVIVAPSYVADSRTTRRGAARQTALATKSVGRQRAGAGQF
jgi:mRNA-degrading endonuclease toxin of MazEF toxin-antitoxin module